MDQKSDETAVSDQIRRALSAVDRPGENVVRTSGGYEVFASIEGTRIPVQIHSEANFALIHRVVVQQVPEGACGIAIAREALALNSKLRCCRLAISEGALSFQSRIHPPQICAEWLMSAVHAVAGASLALDPLMRMLVLEPAIAEAYVKMFPSTPTD